MAKTDVHIERVKISHSKIDYMYSPYSKYEGESLGRKLHYLYHICGLSLAEHVNVGDGKVMYGTELIAIYDYTQGFPFFKFVEGWLNAQSVKRLTERQASLLDGDDD